MPIIENPLAAAEDKGAAFLYGGKEAAYEMQDGGANVTGEVRKKPKEETGGAVDENDFRAEVEVWVSCERLFVPYPHNVDHLWEAEITPNGLEHQFKESSIEGKVVRRLEEEVATGKRGIGFKFLPEKLDRQQLEVFDLRCVHQRPVPLRVEVALRQKYDLWHRSQLTSLW